MDAPEKSSKGDEILQVTAPDEEAQETIPGKDYHQRTTILYLLGVSGSSLRLIQPVRRPVFILVIQLIYLFYTLLYSVELFYLLCQSQKSTRRE